MKFNKNTLQEAVRRSLGIGVGLTLAAAAALMLTVGVANAVAQTADTANNAAGIANNQSGPQCTIPNCAKCRQYTDSSNTRITSCAQTNAGYSLFFGVAGPSNATPVSINGGKASYGAQAIVTKNSPFNQDYAVQGYVTALNDPVMSSLNKGGNTSSVTSVVLSGGLVPNKAVVFSTSPNFFFPAFSLFLGFNQNTILNINDAWGWYQESNPIYIEIGAKCTVYIHGDVTNVAAGNIRYDCESVTYPPGSLGAQGVGASPKSSLPATRPTRPNIP